MGRRATVRTIATDIFGRLVQENPINSKVKGNNNERVSAKWLSDWVGQPFTRVPRSGGARWANTANVCGDVVCENADFNFPFTVETKHLKRVTFTRHLRRNSGVYTIFRQCYEDCIRSKRLPLLLLRKDGMPKETYIVYFANSMGLVPRDAGCEIISTGIEPETNTYIVGYNSAEVLEKLKFVDVVKIL